MEARTITGPALVSYEDTFQTYDGLRLFMQGWCPADETPRSAIALVHGYAEHSGRHADLAHFLVRHGHAVHAFDQRGYGRSEGRRAYVQRFDQYLDDLDHFLERVRARTPDRPLLLLGHSMGGAVGALYCLERNPAITGLILSSPAIRIGDDVPDVLQRLSPVIGRLFPHLPTIRLDRRYLSRRDAVIREAERDPLNYHGRMPARTGAEIARAGRRIRERMEALQLPFLVFHGTADRLADVQGSCELYTHARSTDKTLGLYEGFYHETMNEPGRAQVLLSLAAWLDEHL